jgi:hypothetical protein
VFAPVFVGVSSTATSAMSPPNAVDVPLDPPPPLEPALPVDPQPKANAVASIEDASKSFVISMPSFYPRLWDDDLVRPNPTSIAQGLTRRSRRRRPVVVRRRKSRNRGDTRALRGASRPLPHSDRVFADRRNLFFRCHRRDCCSLLREEGDGP